MYAVKNKYFFNLVEVTLAIGILALGTTAVLALFPIGFEQNRSSIGKNYSAEAASSLLAYISRRSIEPSDPPSIPETGWEELFTGTAPVIPFVTESDTAEIVGEEADSMLYWSSSPVSNDANNIYSITDAPKGVFGIKLETGQTADSAIDFTGKARLWYEDIGSNGSIDISGETVAIDADSAVRVNLEISWPVTRPYNTRNKNLYTLILYNYD